MKENPVKRALRAGKPQIGTWLSLGSIAAARFMARAGFPWLTVDMEHTHTDIQTAAYMFGAIADAGCVPLARIPTGKHEYIKMVLDCGGDGNRRPDGDGRRRGPVDRRRDQISPARKSLGRRRNARPQLRRHGRRNTIAKADDEILVIIQTEHIEAVEIADEIYSVPGVDAVFVGPNDLAYSMRAADGTSQPGKSFRGHPDADPRSRQAQPSSLRPSRLLAGRCLASVPREGWQFIAVNSELKMMLDGAADATRQINRDDTAGELAKY